MGVQLKNLRRERLRRTSGEGPVVRAPDEVFQRARARIDLVFKVQLAIAGCLAAVLVAGLATLVLAAYLGHLALAAGSGGASVIDLVGALILRPHEQVRMAASDAHQLELIYAECHHRLDLCAKRRLLRERIDCASEVWRTARGAMGQMG